MADTDTYACRRVAGGELHLRRASSADQWEISLFERVVNARSALTEGMLRWEVLGEHPIHHETFETPEVAADAVQRLVRA